MSEKRTSTARTFDARPLPEAKLSDIDLDAFKSNYLPQAIDRAILAANSRNLEEQLASLRLFDIVHNCPTHACVLLFGYDRLELINSGGLYGEARPENFPNASDYRNPVLAEAMKVLGYVNRFNFGVRNAQTKLAENGNPAATFILNLATKFQVTIKKHPAWL